MNASSMEPLFEEFAPTSTDTWEARIQDDLGDKEYNKMLVWDSLEGVTLQPYYRRDDLPKLAHVDLSAPASPLVRPDASPANDWRIRQDVGHPDLETARDMAARALGNGTTDLGIAPRLTRTPDGMQFDGVPIQDVEALDTLLSRVDLTQTPLHLTGGMTSAGLLAMLLKIAERQNVDPWYLSGSLDVDPIAMLVRGTPGDLDAAYDLAADLALRDDLPQIRTLAADATPFHNAGASIVQEVACILGVVSEHADRLTERGVSVEDVIDTLHVVVPVSTSYFLEMAKLRTLRLLLAQVLEAFADVAGESVDITPADIFLQAVTSERTQTAYGPYVNVLRGTTEALSAVAGGCDVLRVAPYDAVLRPDNERSARLARNTQLMLKEETHADQVADPAAGSYYVEAATDQIAAAAWDQFQVTEADGGLLQGLRDGRVQEHIAAVRTQRLDEVASRRRVLVGTNHYPDLVETYGHESGGADVPASPLPARTSDWRVAIGVPTLEVISDFVEQGATLADIVSLLVGDKSENMSRDDEGNSTPVVASLPSERLAESFETLRRRTERHANETGRTPCVFLLPIGNPRMRSARATFSRNVFGVAGFHVEEPLRFDTVEAGIDAAAEARANLVVLCSSDDAYGELVPDARDAMQAADLDAHLVVAGRPDRAGDATPDAFVHAGSPLLQTLQAFQDRLMRRPS